MRQNRSLLPEGSRRIRRHPFGKGNAMDHEQAGMSDLSALIEQLCARRAELVQKMAASPAHVSDEHIRDLAALQSAFLAVEAEKRRAEREVLHEEVQQRTSSLPSLP